MTEGDPLAAFRVELKRRREELGLSLAEAARRAGISGPRWSTTERGWEIKQGVQIRANPRRENLIKMANAVGWDPNDALVLVGQSPLRAAESRWTSDDPREELHQLTASLSTARVRALLHVARAMEDPHVPIPNEPTGLPDPDTEHRAKLVETPQEPALDRPDRNDNVTNGR